MRTTKSLQRRRHLHRDQRGQAIVEAVLITTLFLGGAMYVARYFQQNEILASFVSGPWGMVSNMIENGVWERDAKKARASHPAKDSRRMSMLGDEE